MSVKHAILGLFVERRDYGAEIIRRLDDRLGPGFSVPAGTVYTAIGTLEREGDIVQAATKMRGNQPRIYYEHTPAGLDRFSAWMEEPPAREPLRGETHLKLALAQQQHIGPMRAAFERLELECVADIAQHVGSRQLADGLADPVPYPVAARWLLDAGLLERLNSDHRWIRMVLTVLRYCEANGTVPRRELLEALSSA